MFPPLKVAGIAPEVVAVVFADADIEWRTPEYQLSCFLILDFLI